MEGRLKKGLLLAIYSMGCGLMLSIFPFIKSPFNLIFSLFAFVIGIYFFRGYPSLRSRLLFIGLGLLFFFLFTVIITMILYLRSHPQGAV
ncbi:hypothetical protein [Paenibacillus humicola]|uniref:hypothetical protein n=1 Tax=Paenibacillus humicola TaxID=3110540 RepID=UPI00237AC918|nr:hypothetical protein [Paenibacillus humicola]